MSDMADIIFRALIAIQVTHGGEIPPDLGVSKIRELLVESGKKYIVKSPKNGYLAIGHETGMGKAIRYVQNWREATRATSPVGAIIGFGGHALECEVYEVIEGADFLGELVPTPSRKQCFPDD